MSETVAPARSVVIEREQPFAPERIWRALTQPHLIAEWLMANDFAPQVGHRFDFKAGWGAVNCEVRTVEPNRVLAYTWSAMGLESLVTWTLTPTAAGTRLRMEQSGFRPDQEQAFRGAHAGWHRFMDALQRVLEGLG